MKLVERLGNPEAPDNIWPKQRPACQQVVGRGWEDYCKCRSQTDPQTVDEGWSKSLVRSVPAWPGTFPSIPTRPVSTVEDPYLSHQLAGAGRAMEERSVSTEGIKRPDHLSQPVQKLWGKPGGKLPQVPGWRQ